MNIHECFTKLKPTAIFLILSLCQGLGKNIKSRILTVDENFATIDSSYEQHRIHKIATSPLHTCILDIDRDIYCWGSNGYGALGYGDNIPRGKAQNSNVVDIGDGRVAKDIFVLQGSTCVLLETDDFLCWGHISGYLTGGGAGNGMYPNTMGNNLDAIIFEPGTKVNQVSFSGLTGCVLLDNNKVKCFGYNNKGQTGQPISGPWLLETGVDLPYLNLNVENITQISVGAEHACALTNKGLKCWGSNTYGQLGYGDTVPVVNGVRRPSSFPTRAPSSSELPSFSTLPSTNPSNFPTSLPSDFPSHSNSPSHQISSSPSWEPSFVFSSPPSLATSRSNLPSFIPSTKLSNLPSSSPSMKPSISTSPSLYHSANPSFIPSISPSFLPSSLPSSSYLPSNIPSSMPSYVSLYHLPDYNFNETIHKVFALHYQTCVLFDNGKVKCWGKNSRGNLGYNHKNDLGGTVDTMPNQLPFLDFGVGKHVIDLAGFTEAACAHFTDQTLKCWGYSGSTCVLGSETDDFERLLMGDETPIVNFGSRKVLYLSPVALYRRGFCVIFDDLTYFCWGSNGLTEPFLLGQGEGNIGCEPGDMGNEHNVLCARKKVELEITTDSDPSELSWQFFHFTENTLVMETRGGYYKLPNHNYKHKFCAPEGSYGFKIEYSLGDFNGTYEINVNDKFRYEKLDGFDVSDDMDFFLCSYNSQCNSTSVACRSRYCNEGACDIKYAFHQGCTVGYPRTIVLRGLAADSSVSASDSELRETFFGDEFSMKSQFTNCSYSKFNIVPFHGKSSENIDVVDGLVDIYITESILGKSASYVADAILQRANSKYGQLALQMDLVIICIPPGTLVGDSINWKAYAYVNSYLSIYNDVNCLYPSVQIHEVGHNLGLSHSNDEENYGDTSGMMGRSYGLVDGPLKCFNAPKSWALGWYTDGYLLADIRDLIDTQIALVGITDYERKFDRATQLKIINSEDGYDYYMSFNRNTGGNVGTGEGINEVLVTRRRIGSFYDDSVLVAKLGHLQRFNLYNVGKQGELTLQITPNIYLDSDPAYARVSFEDPSTICQNADTCNDNNYCTLDRCIATNGRESCENIPKNCKECGAEVLLEVKTNNFPDEIFWDIQNKQTQRIVQSSVYYDKNNTIYHFSDCFEYATYLFTIFYANSTINYENTATFDLKVGNEVIDTGLISDLLYITATFSICNKDKDCFDYNGCTVDYCNLDTNLCNNTFVSESEECHDCTWFSYDIVFDNFPEETSWIILDTETGALVESGEPYPIYLLTLGSPTSASGRRKAPTRSGRRKAPTRSGRRKAPTRSGRRKAPTRAAPQSNLDYRLLEEDDDYEGDDNVYEMVCLERNIKYLFTITDSFGDGMCCSEGQGYYNITVEGNELKSGAEFASLEEIVFKLSLNEDGCDDNEPGYFYEYNPELSSCVYHPIHCSQYGATVIVVLKTDIYADDSSWQITQNDKIYLAGSKYELAYEEYTKSKCLPYGSYLFNLIDPPSDGMAFCFDQECGYRIEVNNEVLSESDGSFGSLASLVIGICTNDEECDDSNPCTRDFCNLEKKFCIFEQLPCLECNMEELSVDVYTDVLFSLTSWSVVGISDSSKTFSSGPYVKSFHHYRNAHCITLGKYNFTITNSEGRGLTHCYKGSCGFTLSVNSKALIESDGSFEHSFSETFAICDDNSQCDDNDECTLDSCDTRTKICVFEQLSCSSCNKKTVTVNLRTDGNATETSWKILKSSAVLVSGGKYAKNYKKYNHSYCFFAGDFEFVMLDSEGNGFSTCDQFDCGVEVKIDDKVVIAEDGSFEYQKNYTFGYCTSDKRCDDGDPCTDDYCDEVTKICEYRLNCERCGKDQVSVFINTDLNSKEITWDILDLNNHSYISGGPYMTSFNHYEEKYCLTGGEYTFSIHDEGGDGLSSCPDYTCGYKIDLNNETLIDSDGNFEYNENLIFEAKSNQTNEVSFSSRPLSIEPAFIISVAVGFRHTCAVTRSGSVFCWGNNEFGQLGYGDKLNRDEVGKELPAVDLGDGNLGKKIYAGAFHTCVLLLSEEIKCWGFNEFGQLGVESSLNIGSESQHMGNNLNSVDLGLGKTVKGISLGYLHSCAILDDDTLKCWGDNSRGQLGYERRNFNVGDNINEMGDLLDTVNLGNQVAVNDVSAGMYHTCVLMNHKGKCFGDNSHGQLGYGDVISRGLRPDTMGDLLPFLTIGGSMKQISAANSATCAVFINGKGKCFGNNNFAQLGYGDNIQRGDKITDLGDGLPYLNFGNEGLIKRITRGSYSFCVLLQNNDVKCWGWNHFCALGTRKNHDYSAVADMGDSFPIVDFGTGTVQQIEMFHWHACVIFTDGISSCWGFNKFSQLGYGNEQSIGCDADEMGNNLRSIALYEPLSWILEFDQVSSTGNVDEILVGYNVSKSFNAEHFIHSVMDPTCSNTLDDSLISVSSSLEVLDFKSYNKGLVLVFFNYSALETTEYFERISEQIARVDFCLRSDLLLYHDDLNSSVSFLETNILTNVNFDMDFKSFELQDILIKRNKENHVAKDFYVQLSACICNNKSECMESPSIHENSKINLCVQSLREDVEMKQFSFVYFYQDGVLKYKAIDGGVIMPLTTVSYGSTNIVHTRLITSFFDNPVPSNVYIKGAMMFDFRSYNRALSEYNSQVVTFQLELPLSMRFSLFRRKLLSVILISTCYSLLYILIRRRRSNGYVLIN